MKPYDVVGQLQRFDRRNTAFARRRRRETSPGGGKDARSAEEVAAGDKPGYGIEDFALHAGAWAVHRETASGGNASPKPEEMAVAGRSSAEPHQVTDWDALTRRLKRAALLYGASLVGVTRVNPLWLYAGDGSDHLGEDCRTAVVMAVAMDYRLIRSSPAVTAAAATGNGYSRMDFVTTCLARYLTELGYQAVASGNDTALSIPLAIDAGLGEPARNGILVTRPHGPRVRLCKVFTDAPLVCDEPAAFGVREFCEVCTKCADQCPSQSISREPMTGSGPTPANNPGVRKWYVNADQCLAFWRANGANCSNCIRSCPFNKRPGVLYDMARWLIARRLRSANRALVWLDDWLGYGRQHLPPQV